MRFQPNLASALALAALTICSGCGDSDESEPDPTKTDVNAFMTSYFAVFDTYDMADIDALFATDVTADITGIGALEGYEAVRDEWLLPFTSAFPDYSHTVNDLSVADARATIDFVFSGTHQGELLGYAPTGNALVLAIKGTYDVHDEVVTSFTLEYELGTVLEVIAP